MLDNLMGFLGLVFAVVLWVLNAVLVNDALENKGYKAKYWIGLLFGPLAWMYCIALPDLKIQKAIKKISESLEPKDEAEQ